MTSTWVTDTDAEETGGVWVEYVDSFCGGSGCVYPASDAGAYYEVGSGEWRWSGMLAVVITGECEAIIS